MMMRQVLLNGQDGPKQCTVLNFWPSACMQVRRLAVDKLPVAQGTHDMRCMMRRLHEGPLAGSGRLLEVGADSQSRCLGRGSFCIVLLGDVHEVC